jgi:hypothetical protein
MTDHKENIALTSLAHAMVYQLQKVAVPYEVGEAVPDVLVEVYWELRAFLARELR